MAFPEFNRTISGTRPGGGSYVLGVWTPSAPTVLSIETSVQPTPDRQIQALPEGRRIISAYTLYSFTEIREQDVYSIYGDDHEVLRVRIWQNDNISHYVAIAVRMQKEGSL
jgi:hypothetical protein